MEIDNLKKELRKAMKAKKLNLLPEEATRKGEQVFAEIEYMEQFQMAKTVLAFWSLPDEISTHEFVKKWATRKRMVLPVVVGNDLELHEFTGVSQMERESVFGILEPKTGRLVEPSEIDFAIIPGVAFDKQGNRLGRGKGYYDRTLNKLTKAIKVGVAYDFQLFDTLPVTEYDIPVDKVIFN